MCHTQKVWVVSQLHTDNALVQLTWPALPPTHTGFRVLVFCCSLILGVIATRWGVPGRCGRQLSWGVRPALQSLQARAPLQGWPTAGGALGGREQAHVACAKEEQRLRWVRSQRATQAALPGLPGLALPSQASVRRWRASPALRPLALQAHTSIHLGAMQPSIGRPLNWSGCLLCWLPSEQCCRTTHNCSEALLAFFQVAQPVSMLLCWGGRHRRAHPLAVLPDPPPQASTLRKTLFLLHVPLAHHIAFAT